MDSLLKISDSKLFKEISEENRMQIKQDIVDFLYRFKDRHPSSTLFYYMIIIQFLL